MFGSLNDKIFGNMKSISLTVIMAFVFVCGWAQVDHIIQMKEDVKYLASDKLEGRETGTKSERKRQSTSRKE